MHPPVSPAGVSAFRAWVHAQDSFASSGMDKSGCGSAPRAWTLRRPNKIKLNSLDTVIAQHCVRMGLLVSVHFLWACTICLARHIVMAYTDPQKMLSYPVQLKYAPDTCFSNGKFHHLVWNICPKSGFKFI